MSRPAGEIFGAAEGRDDDLVTSSRTGCGIDVESTVDVENAAMLKRDQNRGPEGPLKVGSHY